ncbi:hypothetical protein BKA62DRAFT_723923 [Auriculariales sp. MPI-PUGE-AT-0066]|nr:hypothetical protein BKA62DRAFT_723923 [Auriculariales sp. MPI-PUGE-AT-0066]
MDRLPSELWNRVVAWLSFHDLMCVTQTCSQWRDWALSDPTLWATACVATAGQLEQILERSRRCPIRIQCRARWDADKALSILTQHSDRLEILDILYGSDVDSTMFQCPRLKALRMNNLLSSWFTGGPTWPLEMPKLKIIDMGYLCIPLPLSAPFYNIRFFRAFLIRRVSNGAKNLFQLLPSAELISIWVEVSFLPIGLPPKSLKILSIQTGDFALDLDSFLMHWSSVRMPTCRFAPSFSANRWQSSNINRFLEDVYRAPWHMHCLLGDDRIFGCVRRPGVESIVMLELDTDRLEFMPLESKRWRAIALPGAHTLTTLTCDEVTLAFAIVAGLHLPALAEVIIVCRDSHEVKTLMPNISEILDAPHLRRIHLVFPCQWYMHTDKRWLYHPVVQLCDTWKFATQILPSWIGHPVSALAATMPVKMAVWLRYWEEVPDCTDALQLLSSDIDVSIVADDDTIFGEYLAPVDLDDLEDEYMRLPEFLPAVYN